MLSLVVRRLLVAIPTLLVIIAAAFFLMRAAPGGPFDGERQLPKEIKQRVLAEYDLDRPPHEQFIRYLGLPRLAWDVGLGGAFEMKEPPRLGLLQGSLGPSMKYKNKTVGDIISEGFPTSALIGFFAITLAIGVGCALGIWAALNQNTSIDFTAMAFAVVGVCLPPLVIAPVASLLFGVQLQWLPTGGLHRDEFSIYHLILPIVTLALPQIAVISRLMRASMIEAMRSNAIRTARAKGLPEAAVVWRHALPVAMIPIVSYLGPAISTVLTGGFVIETVYQLPGIGRQFTVAALQRDYTLVMGVVILYASMIIFFNMLADVLYGVLDPRARKG